MCTAVQVWPFVRSAPALGQLPTGKQVWSLSGAHQRWKGVGGVQCKSSLALHQGYTRAGAVLATKQAWTSVRSTQICSGCTLHSKFGPSSGAHKDGCTSSVPPFSLLPCPHFTWDCVFFWLVTPRPQLLAFNLKLVEGQFVGKSYAFWLLFLGSVWLGSLFSPQTL